MDERMHAQSSGDVNAGVNAADGVRGGVPADGYAVLEEVVRWALAGHISESGVTVEAGNAIRAVACGVQGTGGEHA